MDSQLPRALAIKTESLRYKNTDANIDPEELTFEDTYG